MMKEKILSKERNHSGAAVLEAASSQVVSKGAITALGITSAAVGIWVAVSLISGMINAGGPLALAKAWFAAVNGL